MQDSECKSSFEFGGFRIDSTQFAVNGGLCPNLDGLGSNLVMTPSAEENIRNFVQGLLLKVPMIIQGPVGCGKSFLIREMARVFGQEQFLIELSLDDQADSKTLFGSYVCSDIPGEFIWQAGIVTRAATNGYWLLIEDIDKTPLEIISSLQDLLESRLMPAAHRRQGSVVEVNNSFRIFGTRTITKSLGSSLDPSEFVVHSMKHFSFLWHFVALSIPTREEVAQILNSRYPKLLPVVISKLIATYDLLTGNQIPSECGLSDASILTSKARKFSLRDLIKAADRISTNVAESFNTTSGRITDAQCRLCVNELVDVYAAAIREKQNFIEICYAIGSCWNVSKADCETYLICGYPQLHTLSHGEDSTETSSPNALTIGRITIGKIKSIELEPGNSLTGVIAQQFAYTKYSLRLLEQVAACVRMNEPVMLVGETGSGKTTSVQQLASLLGVKLIVQNISLSTDSNELLGGYRPVSMRVLFVPLYEKFVVLFLETFEGGQNQEFLQVIANLFRLQNWRKLLKGFLNAGLKAQSKLQEQLLVFAESTPEFFAATATSVKWMEFTKQCQRMDSNISRIENGFAFAKMDGLLVQAMKNGHWILLDEINLASSETLQALAGILDGQSKLFDCDGGDSPPIVRHPSFRVFAAMNPPTDVGKKELPLSLRCRFTEIYTDELVDVQDLQIVVERYFRDITDVPVADIVHVYLGCRAASELTEQNLVDAAGQRPRYSLRSLTRSLRASLKFIQLGIRPVTKALFEGFMLNFQTQLGDASKAYMKTYLLQSFGLDAGTASSTAPGSRPGGKKSSASDWVLLKPFWVRAGPLPQINWAEKDVATGTTRFVVTKSVEENVRNITAAVAADVAPILLQGPTSVGKTTMIEYLAARTGHKCVRINNHEHTDVAEYIGGYVTNIKGHLEFKDGLLVDALRNGHWIILDELNLAPSDVLEALNRLLDDNKELLIPETGERLSPAPGFALFATQNPPGIYGGRKPLSRAFRNRFLELSIGDLPSEEIEDIITQSCGIPPRFSKMLVKTMMELQMRRLQSNLFQGKYGMVTTRDLIKWGNRRPQTTDEVAAEGYMILAEKLREDDQKMAILTIINNICQSNLNPSELYDLQLVKHRRNLASSVPGGDLLDLIGLQEGIRQGSAVLHGINGIAITSTLCRLWKLTGRCVEHNEPALLIGGTGCGKTTVCQLLAAFRKQEIRILNCHQATETADIIGGLRPVRGRAKLLEDLTTVHLPRLRVLIKGLCGNFDHLTTTDIFRESMNEAQIRSTIVSIKEFVDASVGFEISASLTNEQSETTCTPSIEVLTKACVDRFNALVPELTAVVELIASSSVDKSLSSELVSKSKKQRVEKTVIVGPPSPLQTTFAEVLRTWAVVEECWSKQSALFEWHDGPLVTAMKNGDIFVLDEINLAEDAVIERLNSVLEPSRSITLAEKGGDDSERIVAHPNFKFLATMNPGGDFGKRELSPALRSRFTESFIQENLDEQDVILVLCEILNFGPFFQLSSDATTVALDIAGIMYQFMAWLNRQAATNQANISIVISIREILAWATFVSHWLSAKAERQGPDDSARDGNILQAYVGMVHGAQLVLIDGLGVGINVNRESVRSLKASCEEFIIQCCPSHFQNHLKHEMTPPTVEDALRSRDAARHSFELVSFSIEMGNVNSTSTHQGGSAKQGSQFVLDSQNTVVNMWRVLRAMQINRPILLEGPPGVGKTSLVANLAKLTGHALVRINLSEHSEISDLLGSDLPAVPNQGKSESQSSSPKFIWCDGVFLSAMKRGDWVLLDELNLAPQTVLEGLNACLDHRGEVFLPEIGLTVQCSPTFRVFCAQNPLVEGGGRKGLPQSFLSRFSRVYVESMSDADMLHIAKTSFAPDTSTGEFSHSYLETHIPKMVRFVNELQSLSLSVSTNFAREGSPWEFNLRDILRWCEFIERKLAAASSVFLNTHSQRLSEDFSSLLRLMCEGAYLLFISRLRTTEDRQVARQAFETIFDAPFLVPMDPPVVEAERFALVGMEAINSYPNGLQRPNFRVNSICGGLTKTFESIACCTNHRWPVLLIGNSGRGKRFCVRHLAAAFGAKLVEFSASSSTDSTELLGSFEQSSVYRCLYRGLDHCLEVIRLLGTKDCSAEIQKNKAFDYLDFELLVLNIFSHLNENASNGSNQIGKDSDIFPQIHVLLTSLYEFCTLLSDLRCFDTLIGSMNLAKELFEHGYLLVSGGNVSGFEWVDGVVIEALKYGHWLLISNVNLCSASVLDRLNSILEPNGTLLLTEDGIGETISPHPNFRIFFTMDSRLGDISRAMRNRCVEIFFFDQIDTDAVVLSCIDNTISVSHEYDRSSLPASEVFTCYHTLALRSAGAGELRLDSAASCSRDGARIMKTNLRSIMDPSYPRYRLFLRAVALLQIHERCSLLTLNQDFRFTIRDAIRIVLPFLSMADMDNNMLGYCDNGNTIEVQKVVKLCRDCGCTGSITTLMTLLGYAHLLQSTNLNDNFPLDWLHLIVVATCHRNHEINNLFPTGNSNIDVLYQNQSILQLRKQLFYDLVADFVTSTAQNQENFVKVFESRHSFNLFQGNEEKMIRWVIDHLLSCNVPKNTITLSYLFGLDQSKFLKIGKLYFCSGQIQLLSRAVVPAYYSLIHSICLGSQLDSETAVCLWQLYWTCTLSRFSILCREYENHLAVDEISAFNSAWQLGSLYSITVALQDQRLGVTSPEFRLLLTFKVFLDAIDEFFNTVCLAICECVPNVSVHLSDLSQICVFLKSCLRYRDMLSNILLSTNPHVLMTSKQLNKVNGWKWDPVLAALELIHSSIRSLHDRLTRTGLGNILQAIGTAWQSVSRSLVKVEISIATYFEGSEFSQLDSECFSLSGNGSPSKFLWEFAGHPAVPSNANDWELLSQLGSSFPGNIYFPNYLQSSHDLIDARGMASSTLPLDARAALSNEFVCLFSTMYWSKTSESGESLGSSLSDTIKSNDVDMELLVQAFQAKCTEIFNSSFSYTTSDGTLDSILNFDFSSDLNEMEGSNGGDPFLLLSERTQRLINCERQRNGESAIALILQPLIFLQFCTISNCLGKFILTGHLSRPEAENLRSLTKKTISIVVRYCFYHPKIVRELQSLLWCLDAVLGSNQFLEFISIDVNQFVSNELAGKSSSQSSEENLIHKLYCLTRSINSSIDAHIFFLGTSGMLNCVPFISLQYGSYTLYDLVSAQGISSIQQKKVVRLSDWRDNIHTGIIRVLQPVGLELILKHLDIAATVPSVLNLGGMPKLTILNTQGHNSGALPGVMNPVLIVSEVLSAHRCVLRLFRTVVANSNSMCTLKSNSTGNTLLRKYQLLLHTVDILQTLPFCCSSESTIYQNAKSISSSIIDAVRNWSSVSLVSIFEQLLSINIPQFAISEKFRTLFTCVLTPLLELLACGLFYSDENSDTADLISHTIMIGTAWSLVGSLRLHLVVPTTPVDPSTAPNVKANLLVSTVDSLSTIAGSRQLAAVLDNGSYSDDVVSELAQDIAKLNLTITSFREKAIVRPSDSEPFWSLFDEMKQVCSSLCAPPRIQMFIGKSKQIVDSIRSTEELTDSRIKLMLAECEMLSREEIVWQESIFAYLENIRCRFRHFEDILSPFLSAIEQQATGIRIIVSAVVTQCNTVTSRVKSENDAIESFWKDLLRFPFSSGIDLSAAECISKSAIRGVQYSIVLSDTAVAKVSAWHERNRQLVANSPDSVFDTKMCSDKLIDGVIPHLTMLHGLHNLEYFIAVSVIDCDSLSYALYLNIISQFVHVHLRLERERKQEELEKAAFYKRKLDDRTYETNEEKEELEHLRLHFPDHLQELQGLLESRDGMEDCEINRAQEIPNDALLVDDAHANLSLTGLHARLIFIHMMKKFCDSQLVWMRCSSGATGLLESNEFVTTTVRIGSLVNENLSCSGAFVFDNLRDSSFLVAKALEKSAAHLMAPSLDESVKGGCLLVLSAIAQSSTLRSIGVHRPIKHSRESSDQKIDRDLLFLLSPLQYHLDVHTQTIHPIDFHQDPNPTEVAQACQPLRAIFDRASELLAIFPANEFLLQICKISARINYFHISTPLGKMLSSVELLLRKAEEWEQFAASHTSLSKEMKALSTLIGRWRKVELQSWENLLRCKEIVYVKKAVHHWYSLYQALTAIPKIRVANVDSTTADISLLPCLPWKSLDSRSPFWLNGHPQVRTLIGGIKDVSLRPQIEGGDSDECMTWDEYVASIFDLVDGYLRSSVVGEFPMRLHLVRLFALQHQQQDLQKNFETPTNEMNSNRFSVSIGNIVFGVWEYYDQFLPLVRQFQENLKDPIQAKVVDQIKIGKWDELTTYALIEHSERIHRKLSRLIKEYQVDVLDYPVVAVLRRDIMGDLASEQGDLQAAISIPSTPKLFPHLKLLGDQAALVEVTEDQPIDDEAEVNNGNLPVSVDPEKVIDEFGAYCGFADENIPLVEEIDSVVGYEFSKISTSAVDDFVVPGLTTAKYDFSRLHKVRSLLPKLEKYLFLAFGSQVHASRSSVRVVDTESAPLLFGYRGMKCTEDFCGQIFSRLSDLRKDGVSKSVKYRAISDLLTGLKDQGLSHLRSTTAPQMRRMVDVLALPAPLPCELAGELLWSSAQPPRDTLEKGERYFSRNVSEMAQFRTQVVAPSSKDISHRDIHVMLGLADNLFFNQMRIRCTVAAALNDAKAAFALFDKLRSRLELKYLPGFDGVITNHLNNCATTLYLEFILPGARLLLANLNQLKFLVDTATIANDPVFVEVDAALEACDGACCRQSLVALSKFTSAVNELLVFERKLSGGECGANISELVDLKATSEHLVGHRIGLAVSKLKSSFIIAAELKDQLRKVLHESFPEFLANVSYVSQLIGKSTVEPVIVQAQQFFDSIECQLKFISERENAFSFAHNLRFPSEESVDGNDISVKRQNILTRFCSCLDQCLIAVQKVRKLQVEVGNGTDINSEKDGGLSGCFGENISIGMDQEKFGIQTNWSLSMLVCSSLSQHVSKISECMREILDVIDRMSISLIDPLNVETFATNLADLRMCSILAHSVFPFVRRLLDTFGQSIADVCQSFSSSGKLLYISLRLFRNLLAKGICSADSNEDENEGDGQGSGDRTFQDDVDGTGMGEGEGKKDVSDEIENEDQLMDLKSPNDEQNDSNKPKDSKKKLEKEEAETGVEMSQDFEGDMYDLPEDDEVDDDENEDEEKEDLEREIDQSGDMEDIVDEKQWDEDEDGDEPDQEQKDKEKFEKDSKMDGDKIDGEMRTRDDSDDDADNSDKEDDSQHEMDEDEKKENEPAGSEGNDLEKINEDSDDKVQEKPMGVDVKPREEMEQDDEPDTEGQGAEDTENQDEGDEQNDQFPDDLKLDGDDNDVQDDDEGSAMDEDSASSDADQEEDDHSEGLGDDEDPYGANEHENTATGAEGNIPEENDPNEPKAEESNPATPLPNSDASKIPPPATFGVANQSGEDSIIPVDQAESADQLDAANPKENQQPSSGPKGTGKMNEGNGSDNGPTEESGQHHRNESQSIDKRSIGKPPNPFQSKGDINKEWKRRLNLADRSDDEDDITTENAAKDDGNDDEPREKASLFEKAKDSERSTDQVLDEVDAAQAIHLNREDNEVPEDDNDAKDDSSDQALDDTDALGDLRKPREEKRKRDKQDVSEPQEKKKRRDADASGHNEEEDMNEDSDSAEVIESLPEEEEVPEAIHFDQPTIVSSAEFRFGESHQFAVKAADKEDEDITFIDYSFCEIAIPSKLAEARSLWMQHRRATEPFSARLCEQLRLILEPTLCSRLQGDYRTGKRINMRKVISYVSSGFRKDKIWLRRTKPAKREYQVMLMIDNSSSMGPAGTLALSSLCMISNALMRLEAGDLCVVSFADKISVAHPFGKPFSDESGAQIFNHFDFSAGRTMLGASLQAVQPIFEAAASSVSTSNSVVLQLCFIISDAKLDSDNRSRLDRIVRDLAEQHVLVVLIIIDRNTNPKDSIFNTRTVEFQGNRVVTKPYLENFPFPYYVAIQQIEHLPEVLSDALKQWFEMIRGQLTSN